VVLETPPRIIDLSDDDDVKPPIALECYEIMDDRKSEYSSSKEEPQKEDQLAAHTLADMVINEEKRSRQASPIAEPPAPQNIPVENVKIRMRTSDDFDDSAKIQAAVAAAKRSIEQDEQKARMDAWLRGQTNHAAPANASAQHAQPKAQPQFQPRPYQKKKQALPPPPPPEASKPSAGATQDEKPKEKCFINFYYTIKATSYTQPLDEIKSLVKKRLLAVHPDKVGASAAASRAVDIVTYIKNNIFDSDENRMKYNRLISMAYIPHGSNENTDLEAMIDYMTGVHPIYEPDFEYRVHNDQVMPTIPGMSKMYPASELPAHLRPVFRPPQMRTTQQFQMNPSTVAAAIFRTPGQPVPTIPRAHVPFMGHMNAMNDLLRGYQPYHNSRHN
jgi:hypothetical protein